jgi:hypothetical protein
MILDPDTAYDQPASDIAALQLRAAAGAVRGAPHADPLLARRAEEAGITRIASLADVVPLLFAHTVYKSYPPSFVEQGRWDRMLQWLGTLVGRRRERRRRRRREDVDDWIARLWSAGHMVLATSGSSGKCSFLNQTRGDDALKQRHFRHSVAWPLARPGGDPASARPVFWLGPIKGANSAIEAANINAANWGPPGATFALGDEPLRIADVSRMAAMRKRMSDGTASPQEIAAFEDEARRKGADGQAAMRKLADTILDHRHEPLMLSGMWAQFMTLIARARERGIADGEFHPQSVVTAGGGVKGVPLPADYKEQVDRFFAR